MQNKIRAFIAVNLSVAGTRAVAELEDAVRQECQGLDLRVAWVPAPNLHVTLKFLGWTREEALEAVRDRLAQELSRRVPIDVRGHGLGAFPTVTRPRVIWVGLDDPNGALGELAASVDQVVSELGFIKEERPFKAHMTIGRVKEGKGSLEDVIARHADRDLGVSTIREVVL